MVTRLLVLGAGLVFSVQAPVRQGETDGEMQQRICQWRSALAVALLCLATAIVGHGQSFTSLASFNASNGKTPNAGLVQGLDGNLYGLTNYGGTFKGTLCGSGCGTIFKITPNGSLTTFYVFCSQTNCADGAYPRALVLASDGNFYGTTFGGGNSGPNCDTGFNCGIIFKITPSGALTTLYNFCTQTNCADGYGPVGELVQASDGNLYGTTWGGGAHTGNLAGGGTVFKITPNGVLTTLYSFCALANCADGNVPNGLIQATNGKLYGTTAGGGSSNGTAFSITLAGQLTTLYDFCSQSGCTDGGALFKLTTSGTFTSLYKFCAQTACSDGANPDVLLQASDGNFYGTAQLGGVKIYDCSYSEVGCGTIFKITSSGVLTKLYSFCATKGSCSDGSKPDSLVQATDGNFYGTTLTGGLKNEGTVFRLSEGLGAFVKTLPTSGKVGTAVIILATDLTGATNVSFNGKTADFTVISPTEIKTTVPTSATTGTVTVVTPKGTLKSNVAFRVP